MSAQPTQRPLVWLVTLVLIAGGLYLVKPRWLRDLSGSLRRLEGRLTLREVAGLYPSPMSLELDSRGTVWLVTKYGVHRFPRGDRKEGEALLDPQRYRQLFGRRMNALSSAHLTRDGVLWVGSWYGEVLRFEDGQWSEELSQSAGPDSKIADLVVDADGVLWLAGDDGLWRRDAGGTWSAVRAPWGTVYSILLRENVSLVVGTREGVFVRDGDGWRRAWSTAEGDQEVTVLSETTEGHLLVGTHDGLAELDPRGAEISRELRGSWITGVERSAGGQRVVATWQQGLFLETPSGWRKLGFTEGLRGDSVTFARIDPDDRLWVGLYGEGVFVGALEAVDSFVSLAEKPEGLEDLVFDDACEAAERLLAGGGVSGGIAVEYEAERARVFFDGDQVCPSGPGHRRAAGHWVALQGSGLLLHDAGRSQAVPLPPTLSPSTVTAVYLDSRESIWLGSRTGEVHERRDGEWRVHGTESGLGVGPVEAMVETPDGDVWVGVAPTVDPATGSDRGAGLHRFDGSVWEGFRYRRNRTRRGLGIATDLADVLASGTTTDLMVLSDGRLAIGTNGGLTLWNDGRYSAFDANDVGLVSGFVAGLGEGPEGRLWLVHAYWGPGVTWKSGPIFHNRNSRDGLFEDRLADVAHDAEGRVWLLATSGQVGVYLRETLR